jgi:hypothetical protein
MREYDEYEQGYDFYLALSRVLRRDGVPVDDPRPGDYVYVADGPRIIEKVDEYGKFEVYDYGGPITGGWVRGRRQAYRGGCDHIRARAARDAAFIRWQRRTTGRKHVLGVPRPAIATDDNQGGNE